MSKVSYTYMRNLYVLYHTFGIVLIVTFHLPSGEEHVQYIEELAIVNLQTESTLDAKTFYNGLELATAQHVMHFAQGDGAQELILGNRTAMLAIKVLEHLAEIGDLVRAAGKLHQCLRAEGALIKVEEAIDTVQIR